MLKSIYDIGKGMLTLRYQSILLTTVQPIWAQSNINNTPITYKQYDVSSQFVGRTKPS